MGPDIQRREVREMSGSNGHSDIKLVAQGPAAEQPDLDPSTLAYGQRLISLPSKEGTIRGFSGVDLIIEDLSRAERNCTSRAEQNCTTERRGVSIKVPLSVRA